MKAKTVQEVKQLIADILETTIEGVTHLYHTDESVRYFIDATLNDINERRVQNGLEKVCF
jgi:hypothetical protein